MGTKYKTKFPMARIKKIMQVDEEIGKVAQTTPIVISKALELFLEQLLQHAVKQVAGSLSRISPSVIKRVVLNTEEYDFLKSIVVGVPDVEEARTSSSHASTSSKRTVQTNPIVSNGIPRGDLKKIKHPKDGGGNDGGNGDGDESGGEPPVVHKNKRAGANPRMKISALVSSDVSD